MDKMVIDPNRTQEECFRDGMMHEWLISQGFTLVGTQYIAPPMGNPADMEAAYLRIYGCEIKPTTVQ